MTTIQTILNEFRQAAHSNYDMGDKFERLIANYLVTDPLYQDKYSDVWLWNEWPDRGNQPDTGIDLVVKEHGGDYVAVQCKFYDPEHSLQKGDIDSFFTTSGKNFTTPEGEKAFTSRLIVSTTDKWSKHAETALENQQIPVNRLRVQDLADSPVDWSQFSLNRPQDIKLKAKKSLRPHQKNALEKVEAGFQAADRGKLIMACGTGKTFTSLKIAERLTPEHGTVLFLVPSISLLSQTLREWTAETERPFHSFAVCSDSKVGKKNDNEDISVHDLAFPATTDIRKLVKQIQGYQGNKAFTVIFSTYQSIAVVAQAQAQGLPEFDLIICDEAHRTTGVTLAGNDESHFVKVHDQKVIKAKKRLYMTATPRIFSDGTKTQAQENDALLCSMDDASLYGEEFHSLGFSQAVGEGLLSDYKVMVLAVDEKYVSKAFQSQIADANNEINLDDAVKITGCWNGLAKRMAKDVEGNDLETDTAPMRRAVAFSGSIKDSKKITELFAQVVNQYIQNHEDDDSLLTCEVDHVDGTFNILQRNKRLDWLKEDTTAQGNLCRILSNARCLSEGVDVPALDAVLFLNPRNSIVDVVQSVGRVMRKADGKKYGYVILPIGIPADMPPEEALKDNKKYKVVWQVLQALRAHDDRFNATINKIDLNKTRPDNIQVIGVTGGYNNEESQQDGNQVGETPVQYSFNFPYIEEWRDAIYAKIVVKCGERKYWEQWAKDVAQIAERHTTRIKALLEDSNPEHKRVFDAFLSGLQNNLNPSISEADAIDMLSQHLITKPVFDALFEGYQFTQHNPVSLAMQNMLDVLEGQALEKETVTLQKFYDSVKKRASGIDNAAGKQKIIIELYDKFFKTAFPRMAERLGIVYTPVEVVDFIIHSANDALQQEFGLGLTDAGVHILDPFTGTGTFMVRLLQSGLIKPEDLARKYSQELHANEIILLAYYIAAINIEETYHELSQSHYEPFQGIVLTDTFQLAEGQNDLQNATLPENSDRAKKQQHNDIRVIIGNPPYSAKQENQNEGNQNLKYERLDNKIRDTYVEYSSGVLKNSLYDSYVRAIRWASDRIKDNGIVCYVTNGSFIDMNVMDGLRKCLNDEFTSVYCFNLRGNMRSPLWKEEGGQIFGAGSQAAIAIILLIKNSEHQGVNELFYHDIGDYLNREEKLKIIKNLKSTKYISWQKIVPNESHDWINQRNEEFMGFIAIGNKSRDNTEKVIFNNYSGGVKTDRDTWVYNFSKANLTQNIRSMIEFYNSQVQDYFAIYSNKLKNERLAIELFIDTDNKKFSWTRATKQDLERNKLGSFFKNHIVYSMYRPYCKQWLYFDKQFNEMVLQMPKIFPNKIENLVICLTGIGAQKNFSTLIADHAPNYHFQHNGQCFPRYTYEKIEIEASPLFDAPAESSYRKKDNINDTIWQDFKNHYGDNTISKDDIFYYVYGVLHSPEYKQRFAADLKKMLPRIPFVQDFWAFSQAGRELANWHLNYETVEPYLLHETVPLLETDDTYRVQKMAFAKQGKEVDKSVIRYNSQIMLSGIPPEAYGYVVNGKSALEWIMERYQVTIDKDSGIRNDPNDWSDNPRYILDLLKRIVRVSVETVQIVNGLPALNEHKA